MYIHPNEDNSWIELSGDFINELEAETNQDRRIKIFLEAISDAESPFSFKNFVFEKENFFDKYVGDTRRVILDYVAENVHKWDPDEVACFFLDVATDCFYCNNQGDASYLKKINLPKMFDSEYARKFLWENFWHGGYDDLVIELIDYYKWGEDIVELIELRATNLDGEEADLYKFVAVMFQDDIFGGAGSDVNVKNAARGLRLAKDGQWYEAIECLSAFYEKFPDIHPSLICKTIAECYVELKWRGLAYGWIMRAYGYAPNDKKIRDVQEKVLLSDGKQLEILSDKLQKKFPLIDSSESLSALTLAEFLYRYHGEMLHEYSPIISGYSRTIEMLLKKQLFPKLKDWIASYGEKHEEKRMRYIKIRRENVYENIKERQMTLGKWGFLFKPSDDFNANQSSRKSDNFYYLVRKAFNFTESYSFGVVRRKMVSYGDLLLKLYAPRNQASHEMFTDWESVKEIRGVVFELLEGIPVNTGNLFD